jgi:hypothetical protein
MVLPSEVLGVAPWVIIAAVVSWFSSKIANREKAKKEALENADRLEVHRDELTFQLIASAKQEMSAARVEVDDLREEVKKLRAMENHFYHFQQSLEHLEALLTADTPEARAQAERNARAFLNRMRRLNAARGTITNEAQRMSSEIALLDREEKLGRDMKDGKPSS